MSDFEVRVSCRCQKVTLKSFLYVPRSEPQFHRPHHYRITGLRHWSQRAASFAMRNDADCARAMAEVESVLHELALFTRRSSAERSSPANEAPKAPSLVPASSPIDRLVLDPGLDFVF